MEERNMMQSLQEMSRKIDPDSSNREILVGFETRCRVVISEMERFFAKQRPLFLHGAPFSEEIIGFLCMMSVRLSTSINLVPSFHTRCTILELLHKGFTTSKPRSRQSEESRLNSSASANSNAGVSALEEIENRSFSTWMNFHYRWALAHCKMCVDEDFIYLLKMGITLGAQFLLDDIIPVVTKSASSSGLVMAFMEELLRAGKEERISRDIALSAFRTIFPDMLKYFSLRHAQDDARRGQKAGHLSYRTRESQSSPHVATSGKCLTENSKLASVLCRCLSLGLNSGFDRMISRILVEAYTIPVEYFDEVLLPLLKVFLRLLLDRGADLTEPRVRLLFQQGLAIYIDRYVRPEPRKPTDWTRYARECLCEDCIELNRFLLDPKMEQCRFTKPFDARMHLESQLDADEDDYKMRTDMTNAAHSLVITKSRVSSQYIRESAAWKSRSTTASQNIRSLAVRPLRELLGDQFVATINLRWVKFSSGDLQDGIMNHADEEPAADIELITVEQ